MSTDPAASTSQPGRKPKKSRTFFILAIALCILVAAVVWLYLSTRNIETTDDAQVDGDAVVIAPKVAGYVVTLAIRDNQPVKAGDVLLKIDPRDYIAARDRAAAALALAAAHLETARVNLKMAKVTAPARLAQARSQVDQAAANRDLAAANEKRQTNLSVKATTQQARDQAASQPPPRRVSPTAGRRSISPVSAARPSPRLRRRWTRRRHRCGRRRRNSPRRSSI